MANALNLGGEIEAAESLSQKAYSRIREGLIQNALLPGTPVSEPQLTGQLGISRTALREALVRLELEGYVERSKSGRWHVARVNRDETREIYECRGALEALAAELAATKRAGGLAHRMREELDSMRQAYEKGDAKVAAIHSTNFHDLVVEAAGNQKLQVLMEMLRPRLLQNRINMLEHQTREASFLSQNEDLWEALVEGDIFAASKIARKSAADDLQAALALYEADITET